MHIYADNMLLNILNMKQLYKVTQNQPTKNWLYDLIACKCCATNHVKYVLNE